MPTYLITGASSGIGLSLAETLIKRGDRVIATCRKRASSMSKQDALTKLEADSNSLLTVIEGIDVTDDSCGEKLVQKLKEALAGNQNLDVVIHNAGSYAGESWDSRGDDSDQGYGKVSMDVMKRVFDVNTLGPMRIQHAITELLTTSNIAKVAIISTGMGSISDNTSGGRYAYRCSKAAVNMVARGWASDLNTGSEEPGRKVAVAAIAPGFIATEFGPGKDKMAEWGGKPVQQAVDGILRRLDSLGMEENGKFWAVRSADGEVVEFGW